MNRRAADFVLDWVESYNYSMPGENPYESPRLGTLPRLRLRDLVWMVVAVWGTASFIGLLNRIESGALSVIFGFVFAVPMWSLILILSGRGRIGVWLFALWVTSALVWGGLIYFLPNLLRF